MATNPAPMPAQKEPASESEPEAISAGARHWRRFAESRATGWVLVAATLIAWQLYASTERIAQLPSLSKISEEWWEQVTEGDLLSALGFTIWTTLVGFAIATVVGTTLGFLMGRVKAIWALLEPAVELIRQTPVTALLPLFVLYLGIGEHLQITLVALVATFPILLNAYAGAQSVTKVMHLTAKTFKLSWLQTQREIAIPSALPFVLVGMRQALGVSLVVSVVTGMLVGNRGVGYFILNAQHTLNITALFAGIFSIALFGYGLNQIFLLIEARATGWRRYVNQA